MIATVPRPQKDDWDVAKYRSGFLSATYSAESPSSITGAVARDAVTMQRT